LLSGASLAACNKDKSSDSSPGTKASGEQTAMVHCEGVNECKGKGGCKSAKNECKGKNGCQGQGFVDMSESDCKAQGGKVMAAQP
jgi:hypothetical protein